MSKVRDRIPPGQYLVKDIPVLHEGDIPNIDPDNYRFRIFGLVDKEVSIDFTTFLNLPQKIVKVDFHCVTRWTKLDLLWEGVPPEEILKLVKIKPEAKYVMIHAYGGYTTNLTIDDFLSDDVLFAFKLEGENLPPEYGGPVRLVVPKLYAWKSAKWVNGVEFMTDNKPGFWECRGYHLRGEPWAEERYNQAPPKRIK